MAGKVMPIGTESNKISKIGVTKKSKANSLLKVLQKIVSLAKRFIYRLSNAYTKWVFTKSKNQKGNVRERKDGLHRNEYQSEYRYPSITPLGKAEKYLSETGNKLQDTTEIAALEKQLATMNLTPMGRADLLLKYTGKKLQNPTEIAALEKQLNRMNLTSVGRANLILKYIGEKKKIKNY